MKALLSGLLLAIPLFNWMNRLHLEITSISLNDHWLCSVTQFYCHRVAVWLKHDSRAPTQVRQGSTTRDAEMEPLQKIAEEKEELNPSQRFTHTHPGPCPKGKVTGWSYPVTHSIQEPVWDLEKDQAIRNKHPRNIHHTFGSINGVNQWVSHRNSEIVVRHGVLICINTCVWWN